MLINICRIKMNRIKMNRIKMNRIKMNRIKMNRIKMSPRKTAQAPSEIAASPQLTLALPTWGGKRKGAGRRPIREGTVSHERRPSLASRFPVHIALKIDDKMPSLRNTKLFALLKSCLRDGREKAGFRLAHFSVQPHHLHLIVEAQSAERLSRGIQGLCIRIARRINKELKRQGRVFLDRYFSRILKHPRQVRACLAYVLLNSARHVAQRGQGSFEQIDLFSSGKFFSGWSGRSIRPLSKEEPTVVEPKTWLLSVGWRKHGLIRIDEIPGVT
jgi:putative transposase